MIPMLPTLLVPDAAAGPLVALGWPLIAAVATVVGVQVALVARVALATARPARSRRPAVALVRRPAVSAAPSR